MSEAVDAAPGLGLQWRVKESFVEYIRSLPDGHIVPFGGAEECRSEGGAAEWRFPYRGHQRLRAGLQIEFGGELRMRAHHGMLLVILMDPWLTETESGIELSVVDLTAWPDTSRRQVLGRGPAVNGLLTGEGPISVPLELAAESVELFNGVYPAGTPLATATLCGRTPV
jgi:hypothetical protein